MVTGAPLKLFALKTLLRLRAPLAPVKARIIIINDDNNNNTIYRLP